METQREEIINMVNHINDKRLMSYIYGIVNYCDNKYNKICHNNLPQNSESIENTDVIG